MIMTSKKINITIPEDNLKEIEEFCKSEDMSKSFLIREAATRYIADVNEKKEIERKKKDMEWAWEASRNLRDKSKGFHKGKKGYEVIRESRDRKQ
jgi:metal-responsive CopG/Arc/MetJ family transcriptional regulator